MAAEAVQARLAGVAARRMAEMLDDSSQVVRMEQVRSSIDDVESRLRDELKQVAIFVMHAHETMLLGNANELASGWDINAFYPDAARELEESAKCIAFDRPTAGVFHAMRMLEVGLKALAAHLEIDDPTDPAKRNWGAMLRDIKTKIDEKFDKGSDRREKYERLYASIDAVRNPWRNGSMHVTSFYSGQEALHILRCSLYFLQMLASVTNPSEVEEPEAQEKDGLPIAG
ncbi:hypothetical protein HPDFL43_04855 [Hoeflea phototrophica DFL-43]|uniref:Uncharacterized protein n=2 Tax=Hoeflea TaxID=274591 RepID=A9D3V7_HOEPD|nr:hypothetical protein HPDFL43_04855 [Hoeflea phototrophica DFL-43]